MKSIIYYIIHILLLIAIAAGIIGIASGLDMVRVELVKMNLIISDSDMIGRCP